MQDFRKLLVWEEGQQFAADVYGALRRVSNSGGLRSQLLRAAQSIPANVAEGARRRTAAEFAHFLQTAIASASECESHLDLLQRCEILPSDVSGTLIADVVRVRRRLIALRKAVLVNAVSPPTRKTQTPQAPN